MRLKCRKLPSPVPGAQLHARPGADASGARLLLTERAGISCAYLPSVLSGKRKLSADILEKLIPHLGLNQQESEYLKCLRSLSDSSSPDVRLRALDQIQKSRSYRNKNPKEVEVFHYLDNWYYVALRELSMLDDFSAEPKWISNRLSNRSQRARHLVHRDLNSAFSRPSHFAVLFIPTVFILSLAMLSNEDQAFLIQVRTVLMLFLGVAGGLWVLFSIERVAHREL